MGVHKGAIFIKGGGLRKQVWSDLFSFRICFSGVFFINNKAGNVEYIYII
jgi:hypothetical protein